MQTHTLCSFLQHRDVLAHKSNPLSSILAVVPSLCGSPFKLCASMILSLLFHIFIHLCCHALISPSTLFCSFSTPELFVLAEQTEPHRRLKLAQYVAPIPPDALLLLQQLLSSCLLSSILLSQKTSYEKWSSACFCITMLCVIFSLRVCKVLIGQRKWKAELKGREWLWAYGLLVYSYTLHVFFFTWVFVCLLVRHKKRWLLFFFHLDVFTYAL